MTRSVNERASSKGPVVDSIHDAVYNGKDPPSAGSKKDSVMVYTEMFAKVKERSSDVKVS